MSCIHYKFSNTVENDKIKFDGLDISVADLREAIIKQKNLKSNINLRIVDSQTKKEYSDAKEMLPRNTSVIVSRAPLANAQRVPKSRFKDPTLPQSVCEIHSCASVVLCSHCLKLMLVTSSLRTFPPSGMMSLVLKTVLELDVLKGTVLNMSDFTFFNDNSLAGVLATSSRVLQALSFRWFVLFSVAKKEVCG